MPNAECPSHPLILPALQTSPETDPMNKLVPLMRTSMPAIVTLPRVCVEAQVPNDESVEN